MKTREVEKHFYLNYLAKSEEFTQLINKIDIKDINIKIRQLSNLISIKNSAEYSENLMNEKDALSSKQNAERFLVWVKNNLQK